MAEERISRRSFVTQSAILAAGTAASTAVTGEASRSAEGSRPASAKPCVRIGFHTDAFASTYFSFEKCLEWAKQNGVHYIECGLIDGVSWAHGLGYYPHVGCSRTPSCCGGKWKATESGSRRLTRPIRSPGRTALCAAFPT